MYMKPTLPAVGGLCPIHAWAHSMAFLSMHMGSGPGVAGLSGMQVKPFVPWRSVRILPSASMATTVEPFATLAGAADIALAISCLSVGGFFAPAAMAFTVNKENDAIMIMPHTTLFGSCIEVSLRSSGYYSYAFVVKKMAYVFIFPPFSFFRQVQFLINSRKNSNLGEKA